jgi:hypothetical protein
MRLTFVHIQLHPRWMRVADRGLMHAEAIGEQI